MNDVNAELLARVLALVPEDGSSMGNQSLYERLKADLSQVTE